MDENSAKEKSLQDIIALMDGHMMKGYQNKLPKKPSLAVNAGESGALTDADISRFSQSTQSPGDMFEAAQSTPAAEGEPEMDDAAMQELMKMYEEEGTDEPEDVNGLY